jgi:MscS family membrane protein
VRAPEKIMPRFSKLIPFCIFLVAVSLPVFAQSALTQILSTSTQPASSSNNAPVDPYGRATPSGTVLGFLQAAGADNYSNAAQYLQMSAARRQSEGDQMSMKLYAVMNVAFPGSLKHLSAQPEGAPQEGVPLGRQNLGTMSSGDVEVPLELVRVSDPNAGKIWLFSADTLAKVPELYDQVKARRVETKLPKWLVKHQLGGMPLWQWAALLLALPLAAGLAWLILFLLEIPLRWWAAKHGQPGLQWKSVSAPVWLLLGTIIHRILEGRLGMPLLQRHYYGEVAAVVSIISANWILWRVVRWSLRRVRNRALAHGHGGTGSLMLLGERMVKAVIVVLAIFSVLGILGVNLSTALAGVGIGGLAIGFGAQQTIANLFGGVSVLGDEVIRVGDVCKFADRTGVVEDIGLRSTRVRTEDRTVLVIPNGTVATINVENFSRREKILFKTVLGFHPDTPADDLRSILSEIRGVLSEHSKIEKNTTRVRLIEVAPASLNVELVCYVLTLDYDEFTRIREDVLLRIMHFVEDSGASLASPQKLYISDGASKEKLKAVVPSVEESKVAKKASSKQA